MKLVVVEIRDEEGNAEEVAVPPFTITDAGGNRVTIINTLDKALSVTHHGRLDADDPLTVPRRGSGAPPRVTADIAAQYDTAGTVFQLNIQASVVRALGFRGDPTIIIL